MGFVRDGIGMVFRIDDLKNINVLILPISYSLGTFINAGLLWFFFQRDFDRFSPALRKSFLQTFIASIVMGVFAYFSLNLLNGVFDINTFWGIFLQGFLSGITGLIVLVFVLKLLGNEEVDEILLTIKQRLHLGIH